MIKVGAPIRIAAQLHDGNSERAVFVNISNEKDELLARARMSAGAKGIYFLQYEMPDCEFITAQIEVDGLDDMGQQYAMASTTYYADKQENIVVGEITATEKAGPYIIGVACEA